MSFDGGNKPKNRKPKPKVSSNENEKTVPPFNFGGSNKSSNNRGKGPLAATNGAVFI